MRPQWQPPYWHPWPTSTPPNAVTLTFLLVISSSQPKLLLVPPNTYLFVSFVDCDTGHSILMTSHWSHQLHIACIKNFHQFIAAARHQQALRLVRVHVIDYCRLTFELWNHLNNENSSLLAALLIIDNIVSNVNQYIAKNLNNVRVI